MKTKALLFGICFMSLLTYASTANAVEQMMCDTIVIDCGDGPVTNGLICGSNGSELADAARDIAHAVCD